MNGLYAHAPCYLPIARVIMYLSYILKPYKEKKKKEIIFQLQIKISNYNLYMVNKST